MIEIFAIVFLVFVLIPLAVAAKSFAPWIPTDSRDLERIFKIVKLKPGEIFYELGCGDGRVVFYANKKFGNRCVGIELALPLFLLCKLKQIINKQFGVKIKNGNLFKEDIGQVDVIYLFGIPQAINNRLRSKMEKELKKGARVISYCFPIEGWKPILVDQSLPQKHPIFLYQR